MHVTYTHSPPLNQSYTTLTTNQNLLNNSLHLHFTSCSLMPPPLTVPSAELSGRTFKARTPEASTQVCHHMRGPPLSPPHQKASAVEDIALKFGNVPNSGAPVCHSHCPRAFACAMAHAKAFICVPFLHAISCCVFAGGGHVQDSHLRRIRSATAPYTQHRCAPAVPLRCPHAWPCRCVEEAGQMIVAAHRKGRR